MAETSGEVERLREAVRILHEWLEVVERERHRQGAGYMGLDHRLGENVGGCTGCTAWAATAPQDFGAIDTEVTGG